MGKYGISAAILAVFVAGCSLVPRGQPINRILPSYCQSEKPLFSYAKLKPSDFKITATDRRTDRHRLFLISYKSSVSSGGSLMNPIRVNAEYWMAEKSDKNGVVIAVPIVGGPRFPSDRITDVIVSWNIDPPLSVVNLRWSENFLDPNRFSGLKSESELLNEMAKVRNDVTRIIADIRRLIDWLESRPEIDAAGIGIGGGSLGSVLSSLAMGVEPRIKAGFFMAGGGNLHQLFSRSRASWGRLSRAIILPNFGWTPQVLEEKIRPVFQPIDPVFWAGCVNPENVLIVDADESAGGYLPPEAADDLWNAMGRPERIIIRLGHKNAFLSMTPLGLEYANWKMINHFNSRLR